VIGQKNGVSGEMQLQPFEHAHGTWNSNWIFDLYYYCLNCKCQSVWEVR
jgi:hypothetical protein